MRVLFLTLYPDMSASARYRVYQFIPYLVEHGVDCTVAGPLSNDEWRVLTGPQRRRRPFWYHWRETRRRLVQLLKCKDYDVVFVQKAIMTAYIRGARTLLRTCAEHIVYDIDDAVHLAPPHALRMPWRMVEDRRQVFKVMADADVVLAGNDWLVSEATATGANAVRFPTVVDTNRFVGTEDRQDVFRIGWMGSPSTTRCLDIVAPVLDDVRDATTTLVGADPSRVPLSTAEIRNWSIDSEVRELNRFSVGVMPLPQTRWMRGKCALKALLYMACGIPCIATPFGAVLEFMHHGENGFFAEDTEQWRDALEQLRDPALRRRIGEVGRATVEESYSLDNAAPELLKILGSIV